MTITYLLGDTREQVATIPDGSVSLVACSPPFIALRSYLPADHPMKHAEIGSEPDPATFLDTLLALTAEWGRVLAPWGSIAIELGDTYSGNNTAGWERDSGEFRRETRSTVSADGRLDNTKRTLDNWPRPKCLALVPQAYALSLAYGRNVLNGEPSPAGQWLVRNMIVWHRPNPAVGALGDKFRPSTSYITVATRSPKRWFDLTAVRTAPTSGAPGSLKSTAGRAGEGFRGVTYGGVDCPSTVSHPAGAPPLDAWFDEHDTWTMTTQPSSLAHYAMWPAKLAERLVLSMCPAEVCGTCGEPRRRVEKATRCVTQPQRASNAARSNDPGFGNEGHSTYETLGWTDCGHDNYRPGVVLDPFGGTGTTNAVAELHGRDSIWVDIDERNRALVPQRMAEVSRSLFGTKAELPGQGDLFGGAA
jgi:site-specific DNA-methyltransferase (adenine-specific)